MKTGSDFISLPEWVCRSTFMEDIFPNIQQIQLHSGNVKNAKKTGYYKRKNAVGCTNADHGTEKYQNRANYLWNSCTFYPEAVSFSVNGFKKGNEQTNQLMQYGFFESYLTDVDSNPFINDMAQQVSGATVTDEDKNISILGTARANTNESTLLHPSQTTNEVPSNYLSGVAHTILNTQPDTVEDMAVQVLGQKREYVKISDTSILVDYMSDKKYTNETSYVKISVDTNGNNLPGVITKIVLKKGAEEKTLKLYTTKDSGDECEKESYSYKDKTVSGYKVDGLLYGYIPYSLKDWADGYTTIELTTVGRIERTKKDGTTIKKVGDEVVTEISIGERTLFDLS